MLLTTTAKVNAVKKLVRAKKYEEAQEIADKINPARVASVYDLSAIAEVYMRTGRLEDAKELYLEMYGRNKTHKVMTGLIEICLKLKEPKEAEQYLREFRRMEPDNPERLVYRYRVDCMLGKDPEFLIKSLAKLKNEEYTDVWALELAKAYYKNSDRESCAKECHQIMKYFPDSEVAEKAKVLLGACETTEEAPESIVTEATEEPFDTTANVESLMDDVSALLEENARAEAVANETVDEKVMAQAMPAHPEPYLRTPEFLSLHEPAGEDRSIFGGDEAETAATAEEAVAETAEEATVEETEPAAAAVAETPVDEASDDDDDDDDDELTGDELEEYRRTYVLPETLEGKIDRVIFDDDDDDEDEDDGETAEAVEAAVAETIEETADEVAETAAEAVEVTAEAAEDTEAAVEETVDEIADAAEEAVETAAEAAGDTEAAAEETVDEIADAAEAVEELADEADTATDEAEADEEESLPTEEPDSDDEADEFSEDDVEDEWFGDDDAEDDLEFEDEAEEDGEDSEEEEDEHWDGADDIFGDEDDSEDEDEVYDEENFPEEETGDSTDGDDVVIAESDFADAELEAVAERLGNEVCSATEEAKGQPADAEEDDAAKMMADTQVVPFVREKQDIPDEDMEKMLFNLLKDIGGKDTK
ncbi:MAG: hypothetical protein IKI15_03545 [Lachnospiraceae bacterium]|nr:hypothetical protein [Lachnospiraceae bacterium]